MKTTALLPVSINGDVMSLAQALGVWLDGGLSPGPERHHLGKQWVMWASPWAPSADREFWMRWWTPGSGDTWESASSPFGPFDAHTAALLLFGHANGIHVDLGECPSCRERGWTWERRFPPIILSPGESDTWLSMHGPLLPALDRLWVRPCPRCTVGGESTGRQHIDWADAIVHARSRPCPRAKLRHGLECRGGVGPHPHGFLEGATCTRCKGLGYLPGHAETRESLAVIADRFQARGDEFGTWLAAWLADDSGKMVERYADAIARRVRVVEAAVRSQAVVKVSSET